MEKGRFVGKFAESFRAARSRVNPEGLAIGGAISFASPGVMIPMEVGITYAIHEASKDIDPSLTKYVAIGLLGIANAVSVAIETRTLEKKQYSASPIGSTLNIATGKPLVASISEHVINSAQFITLNPVNVVALINNDPQLAFEGAVAASLTLTAWFSSINTLILKGRIDPVVNRIKNIRRSLWSKIKK